MDDEIVDKISIRIDAKFKVASLTSPECSIFKAPPHLLRVNKRAYEPEILAIGPYHRGKARLKPMEDRKILYLRMLLSRTEENNMKNYVIAMKKLEERALKCYAEYKSCDNDEGEFAEMMLIDGCFIVELIRKYREREFRDENELNFNPGLMDRLRRDMLLLENQLPFFVLLELFRMSRSENEGEEDFKRMIFFFLEIFERDHQISNREIKHLLDLFYDGFIPRTGITEARDIIFQFRNWNFPCATELRETAGIKFKLTHEDKSPFYIKFKNGIMEMGKLYFDVETETLLANLVAHEQLCSQSSYVTYANDYFIFMNFLIKSPKDVELLCQQGIIYHPFGGDDSKVVSFIFNMFPDVPIFNSSFAYSEVLKDVHKYCCKRRNKLKGSLEKWMTKLWQEYFNSPWAFIAFLGAVSLLLLTVTQTVFSILAYRKT